MVLKLDENEHWSEDWKQAEMWPDDIEKEKRTYNTIVILTIAIGAILLGFALYFA